MRSPSKWICSTLAFGLLGLAACANPGSRSDAMLQRFSDCNQMENYVKDVALESVEAYGNWGGGWWWGGWRNCFDCFAEDALAGAADNSGGASSYSETNTQEAGVDEADFVKNDNQYIYVLSGQELVVLDAWPPTDMSQLSATSVEGWPTNMYLHGDQLVVFSSLYNAPEPASGATVGIRFDYGLTKVSVFDASDKTDLQLVRELYVDGYLYDSRRVGDQVFLVLYHPTRGPSYPEWRDEFNWNPNAYQQALKRAVRDSTIEDWMPWQVDLRKYGSGWLRERDWTVGCTEVYRPDEHHGLGLVSVRTLDLADPGSGTATAVLSNVGEVYASSQNLYVTEAWWGDQPWWSSEGEMQTRLHRFDIVSDPGRPTYQASGAVPGWLLNSFSMDEHDGHVRVATTEGWWGADTKNSVFVLSDGTGVEKGQLEIVGDIRDIAPGETIYSARFMDEEGYIVTFERTDPLFTMDLSDPTDPVIKGELHVTGFSNYLHPLGDEHLIGLGEEVDPNTMRVEGMQVSLFDVGDLSNPALNDREIIYTGWSWSEAQWDHHAFNYFAEYDTLAVPAVIYDDSGSYWDRLFTGLKLYEITPQDGVTPVGELDHTALARQGEEIDPWYDAWCAQVRRSVFMEDNVYAISSGGVVVSPLSDLSNPSATVTFEDWGGCYYGVW
jgi:hypothetical protein